MEEYDGRNELKAAIEYLVTLLFNFYTIYYQNHRAHAYRDQIANLIENYDGDLKAVDKVLDTDKLCGGCRYSTTQKGDFVYIDVFYTLRIQILNLRLDNRIKGLSYLPQKSS